MEQQYTETYKLLDDNRVLVTYTDKEKDFLDTKENGEKRIGSLVNIQYLTLESKEKGLIYLKSVRKSIEDNRDEILVKLNSYKIELEILDKYIKPFIDNSEKITKKKYKNLDSYLEKFNYWVKLQNQEKLYSDQLIKINKQIEELKKL